MARKILVTEIGRDYSNDSMRYRVEITGSEQRTFEARIPLTTAALLGREEEIRKLYSHGPLPENGEVKLLGDLGW